MELLLDRANPLHWIVVLVLAVSGAATAWLGVRDGLLRRRVRASSGELTGAGAVAAGLVYVASGLAGLWGAAWFVLGGH
jgi:VIT1/CCC1 family predicted Fe2+/Mn2+ transporter